MCVVGQREYELSTSSLSAARNFGAALVIASLTPTGWQLADDTALIISEFVTSAVKAGARRAEVDVVVHVDEVGISVIDNRNGAGGAADPEDADSLLGRSMVAGLAGEHGVTTADGRTTAWARLSCDRVYTAHVTCERR